MISRALMESSLLSVNSARSIYSIYGEILQILYIHDRTIYIDHLCTYYARLHLPGNLTYSRIPSFLISNDNTVCISNILLWIKKNVCRWSAFKTNPVSIKFPEQFRSRPWTTRSIISCTTRRFRGSVHLLLKPVEFAHTTPVPRVLFTELKANNFS